MDGRWVGDVFGASGGDVGVVYVNGLGEGLCVYVVYGYADGLECVLVELGSVDVCVLDGVVDECEEASSGLVGAVKADGGEVLELRAFGFGGEFGFLNEGDVYVVLG